MLTCINQ